MLQEAEKEYDEQCAAMKKEKEELFEEIENKSELIHTLQSELHHHEDELREKDILLESLTKKISELEQVIALSEKTHTTEEPGNRSRRKKQSGSHGANTVSSLEAELHSLREKCSSMQTEIERYKTLDIEREMEMWQNEAGKKQQETTERELRSLQQRLTLLSQQMSAQEETIIQQMSELERLELERSQKMKAISELENEISGFKRSNEQLTLSLAEQRHTLTQSKLENSGLVQEIDELKKKFAQQISDLEKKSAEMVSEEKAKFLEREETQQQTVTQTLSQIQVSTHTLESTQTDLTHTLSLLRECESEKEIVQSKLSECLEELAQFAEKMDEVTASAQEKDQQVNELRDNVAQQAKELELKTMEIETLSRELSSRMHAAAAAKPTASGPASTTQKNWGYILK
eukprot:TRINITY_DN7274_c0_g1_i3.p1 TRINITY_DN7274_c0_g1~~TRINITY_DN7274_c0_g1_i3.p1  ORF type:complete len:431 (+),score=157.09 TRINITY_DN7274_c0_g1_i3:82-1293(+)